MSGTDFNDALEERRARRCPRRLRQQCGRVKILSGWSFIGEHQMISPRMLVKELLPYTGVAFIGGQIRRRQDLRRRRPCGGARLGHVVFRQAGQGTRRRRLHRSRRRRAARQPAGRGRQRQGRGRQGIADCVARRRDAQGAADVELVGKQLLELGDEIRSQYGVRLGCAIIDTVAGTFDLTDEDNNSECAAALKKTRQIGDMFGGLVALVHHYGKSAGTGLRGGSAWRAGADVVLRVVADRKEVTGEIAGREFALAKARDGVEGRIAAFDLAVCRARHGRGWRPVRHLHRRAAIRKLDVHGKEGEREPASHRTFRDAFTEALDGDGKTIRIRHDGPAVRAVNVATVRAQFNLRYATGETDPEKRRNTQRKAFGRALTQLSGRFPTWVDGDTEWMWSI